MAAGFDGLVESLLFDVALSGSKGVGAVELSRAVRAFYESTDSTEQPPITQERRAEEQRQLKETDDLLFSEAPPMRSSFVDDSFLETVWVWLSKHPNVEIRVIDSHDDSTTRPDEGQIIEKQLPSFTSRFAGRRIFTGENRIWQVIAGHDKDLKRLPQKEFECLSVIATFGPKGCLQPDVTRLTKQDKRSVPARTDRLANKGYIVKERVLGVRLATSILKLKRFAKDATNLSLEHSIAFSETNKPYERAIFYYESWYSDMMRLLKENGGIIALKDLRIGLNIYGKTWETKAFMRCVGRLCRSGCIRRLRARLQDSEQDSDKWIRCIQLVGEPKELDRLSFITHRGLKKPEKYLKGDNSDKLYEDGALDDNELDELDDLSQRIPPQWTPEIPFTTLIYNLVTKAGPNGISSLDLSSRATGPIWRRPFDEYLTRLTEIWHTSQPPHLRHLTIIKDTDIRGKHQHFIYRTLPNFEKAVKAGNTEWEAVQSASKMDKKGKKSSNGVFTPPVLDSWGFPKLQAGMFAGDDGRATLAECQKSALLELRSRAGAAFGLAEKHGTLDENNTGHFGKSRKFMRRELDFSKRSSSMKRSGPSSRPSPKQNRRVTNEREIEEYRAKARKTAEMLAHAEISGTNKRKADDAALDDSSQPAKFRRNDSDIELSNLHVGSATETRIKEIESAVLNRTTPGVYINPPGSKDMKLTHHISRGRPRKALIVVFKSDELRKFPWFKNETARFAPKSSQPRVKKISISVDETPTPELELETDTENEGPAAKKQKRSKDDDVELTKIATPDSSAPPPIPQTTHSVATVPAHAQPKKRGRPSKATLAKRNQLNKAGCLTAITSTAPLSATVNDRSAPDQVSPATVCSPSPGLNTSSPPVSTPTTQDQESAPIVRQPRKRGRPSKAMIAERNRLRIEDGSVDNSVVAHKRRSVSQSISSRPSLIVKLPMPPRHQLASETLAIGEPAETANQVSRPSERAADQKKTKPSLIVKLRLQRSLSAAGMDSATSNLEGSTRGLNEFISTPQSFPAGLGNLSSNADVTPHAPECLGDDVVKDTRLAGATQLARANSVTTESRAPSLLAKTSNTQDHFTRPSSEVAGHDKEGVDDHTQDYAEAPNRVDQFDRHDRCEDDVAAAAELPPSLIEFDHMEPKGAADKQAARFSPIDAADGNHVHCASDQDCQDINGITVDSGCQNPHDEDVAITKTATGSVEILNSPEFAKNSHRIPVSEIGQVLLDDEPQPHANLDISSEELITPNSYPNGESDARDRAKHSPAGLGELTELVQPGSLENLESRSTRKGGMNRAAGIVRVNRVKTILDLVHKSGGAFPGNHELWYPFVSDWEKRYDQRPDRHTLDNIISSLLKQKKLKKFRFEFEKNNKRRTRHILLEPDIDPTSPQVKSMQRTIIKAFPRQYVPGEVFVAEDLRRAVQWTPGQSFDTVVGDGDTDHQHNDTGLSNWLDDGFPTTEGVTVKRTTAAVEYENAEAEVLENGDVDQRQKRKRLSRPPLYKDNRQRRQEYDDDDASEDYEADETDLTPEQVAMQSDFSLASYSHDPTAVRSRPLQKLLPWKSLSNPFPQRRIGALRNAAETHARILEDLRLNHRVQKPSSRPTTTRIQSRVGSLKRQNYSSGSRRSESLSLMTCPDQVFHGSSGTFGTCGFVISGRATSPSEHNMLRNKLISAEDSMAMRETCPNDINEILNRAAKLGHPPAGPTESVEQEFYRQTDCVKAWEDELTKKFNGEIPQFEDMAFINHGLNRRHVRFKSNREQKLFEFADPASGTPSSNLKRPLRTGKTKKTRELERRVRPLLPWLPGNGASQSTSTYNANDGRHGSATGLPGLAPSSQIFPSAQSVHPQLPNSQQKGFLQWPYSAEPNKAADKLFNTNAMVSSQRMPKRPYKSRKPSGLGKDTDATLVKFDKTSTPTRRSKQKETSKALKPVKRAAFREYERLGIAIALVRLLCSGTHQAAIRWDVVAHAMSFKYEVKAIRQRWNYFSKKHGGDAVAKKLEKALQKPFLEAYETGELSSINFDDLGKTDWPALVTWCEAAVLPLDENKSDEETPDLPASRGNLQDQYDIVLAVNSCKYNPDDYFTAKDPGQLTAKLPFGHTFNIHTLENKAEQDLDLDQNLQLVKSWTRATAMTKDSNYDVEKAARKLTRFSAEALEQAISEMLKTNTLAQIKKGRQLPGRNFTLNNYVLQQFKRWPDGSTESKFLRNVANSRSKLLQHFNNHGQFDLSLNATESDIAVLTNLVSQGYLRIKAVLPERNDDFNTPGKKLSIWGYGETVLQQRWSDASNFRFPVLYEKTPTFTTQHGLKSNEQRPIWPGVVAHETELRIPFWVDIHGNFLDDVWEMVVSSVLHVVVFRTGCTAKAIEQAHKDKLWAWEINMVLQWMEKVGITVRYGVGREEDGTWEGGWRASEWWYCAFLPGIVSPRVLETGEEGTH